MTEGLDVKVKWFATRDASPSELDEIRTLLDRAFGGAFTEDDWQHSVGGLHIVGTDDGMIVSHASIVRKTLTVGVTDFDTGYVEAVATEPGRQGRGFGTAVMRQVARHVRTEYEFAALSTGEHHFYERLGWEPWLGPTFVRDGSELIRSPEEDDGIMVLRFGPSAGVDLHDPIVCEARSGDDW